MVASLNVSDGTLRYRDLKNGGELTATQINLKVNDFEWEEPFDIQLEAAVMAAEHNLKFKGRVGPIAGNRDYRDVPLDAQSIESQKNSARMSWKRLLIRRINEAQQNR